MFNATQVYRGTWDYTITPTLVSRFCGGFNYFREDHGSMAISADSPQSEGFSGLLPAGYWKSNGICIPNYPECANFPIITTGDFAGLGTNGPNGSDRLVFELHEDMTKIKGFTLSSGVTLTATATTTASDLRRFCWKR